jgi:excisionase family DNA binding protein
METTMQNLLSLRDFQEKYRVSRSTIYRLIGKGELTVVHIGRAVRIPVQVADGWFDGLSEAAK